MKFKPGDVVECVEPNKSIMSPKLGEHCIIRGYIQQDYNYVEPLVKLEGIDEEFYERRFKLVKQTITLPF